MRQLRARAHTHTHTDGMEAESHHKPHKMLEYVAIEQRKYTHNDRLKSPELKRAICAGQVYYDKRENEQKRAHNEIILLKFIQCINGV